jgi:hypothetical protein
MATARKDQEVPVNPGEVKYQIHIHVVWDIK